MDIQNFNKKLNKISALADNGNADGHFSSLERDLLLSYIRELYEIVFDGKSTITKSVSTPPITVKKEESFPIETQVHSVEKHIEEMVPVIVPTEIKREPEVILPKIIKEELLSPVPELETLTFSNHSLKNQNPDALTEMFAEDKITDLSGKLASSQVKDLTKSMGINERIFTQQELFGNNQQVFNETLQRLNLCQNFGEAKQYLEDHIIYKYDWTNENKVKKAVTFIKYIKRKFA